MPYFHDLSYDNIVNLHLEVQTRFSSVHRGIKNKGLLESIARRPSQKHYNHEHFPDIYSKCASLMEAIIKWHPFIDGNKRTGLLAASYYMHKNNCILVTPISSARFTVLIARDKKTFEDIVQWVQTHTAHNVDEYITKFRQYVVKPIEEIISLYTSGDAAAIERGKTIMDEWLALDIYPEYRMEEKETLEFLRDLINRFSPPNAPPPPPSPPPAN